MSATSHRAHYSTVFVALVVGIIIGLFAGRCSHDSPSVIERVTRDTVIVHKQDTVVTVETRTAWREPKPGDTQYIPVEVLQHDTLCKPFGVVGDTVKLQDSAFVVPKFRYPSCTFDIQYQPPIQRVITVTRELFVKEKEDRFCVGAGLSYGATLIDSRVYLAPSASVGVYYKLFGF